jgi:hypothetical protein
MFGIKRDSAAVVEFLYYNGQFRPLAEDCDPFLVGHGYGIVLHQKTNNIYDSNAALV